jgi:hypothetical protein
LSTVTPNFLWPVPQSTDLVKDGATAIEALGDSIDASLVDLKGGTTGQVLSKTSNTDMDFTWVAQDDSNAIQNTIVDAKGDLIAATAADTPARLAVGTNGQVLTADSTAATGLAWATASVGSTNVAGKNALLNSNFSVWQRGTSVTDSGSSVKNYTADQWNFYRGALAGPSATVSRQATGDTTNLPFIQYCARVQRNAGNTGTTIINLYQSLETLNSVQFAGKTVTISFYARAGANYSASSSNLSYFVNTGTGTDQNGANNGFTGLATPINSTATLTTTWQRFSASGTCATNTSEIGVGFTFTPTGTAGANDYYEITGVQLEIAGSASAYSPNTATYQAELAACQRYYFRNTPGTNYGIVAIGGVCFSSTTALFGLQFPVPMRVYPSSAEWGNLQLFDSGNSTYALSAVTVSALNSGTNISGFEITASGLTTGRPCVIRQNNNSSGYIGFSAEL